MATLAPPPNPTTNPHLPSPSPIDDQDDPLRLVSAASSVLTDFSSDEGLTGRLVRDFSDHYDGDQEDDDLDALPCSPSVKIEYSPSPARPTDPHGLHAIDQSPSQSITYVSAAVPQTVVSSQISSTMPTIEDLPAVKVSEIITDVLEGKPLLETGTPKHAHAHGADPADPLQIQAVSYRYRGDKVQATIHTVCDQTTVKIKTNNSIVKNAIHELNHAERTQEERESEQIFEDFVVNSAEMSSGNDGEKTDIAALYDGVDERAEIMTTGREGFRGLQKSPLTRSARHNATPTGYATRSVAVQTEPSLSDGTSSSFGSILSNTVLVLLIAVLVRLLFKGMC